MKKILVSIIFLFLAGALLAAIQTPDEFLGFKLGSDRNLAHYEKIKEYLLLLAKESPRVKTFIIGKTTLNHDMAMTVVSDEKNIRQLDKYTAITRQLSQVEVEPAQAEQIANEGKTIVFISCNLHSDEIASNQMSMELVYYLATANDPQALEILNNVILVLLPSTNPDGQIMTVEWYNKYKGTEFEGTDLPYLYHWYAGHDDNRDWFRLSLKETRLVIEQMYQKWYPQIILDEHQMGSSGDRFFVPPFNDPPTPGLHPLVWRWTNLIGARIAVDLEKLNYAGVASRGFFTGWWIGALDDTGWFHNVPGILFEAASVNLATPIYVEPEEVHGAESWKNETRIFSPNPWQGGWWRLRDIMNYDFQGTLSVLGTAARNRRELLLANYQAGRENIKRGESEPPYAFIIPGQQHDPMVSEEYVRLLLSSAIRVFRLKEAVRVGNVLCDAGSFVVPLAQPYRAFVKNIFENQHYPDLRRNLKEERDLPYDMAAWTLPLGLGLKTVTLAEKATLVLAPVTVGDLQASPFPPNLQEYIMLDSRHNNSYRAAFELLAKGKKVYRNIRDPRYPTGTFLVRRGDTGDILRSIHAEKPLLVESCASVLLSDYREARLPRIAIYQNWGHNMNEGWLRYVCDEFKIPFVTVHAKDVTKMDFAKNIDILIFSGASETEIESAKPPKKWEKWSPVLPAEYMEGIGEKGQKVLEQMVKEGKALIFMDESCPYAINKFKMPVTNIIEEEENGKVVCPGSYLQVELKESELNWGMPKTAAIFYRSQPTFETDLPKTILESRSTPMIFPERDLLLSGWLDGEDQLERRSLIVDYRKGKGRIILIGPDLIYRTHSLGTYKIIFNTLLSAAGLK